MGCGLSLLLLAPHSQAETITIGKGRGIVWEGKPFNVTLSGPMFSPKMEPQLGLLAISSSYSQCQVNHFLGNIEGYRVLPIANGVGLLPRATGTATYFRADGNSETLSGTIGLPENRGATTAGAVITNPIPGGMQSYWWCLPPGMAADQNFYDAYRDRTATITGNWVLVANGSQTSGETVFPTMYAGSFSYSSSGDKGVTIWTGSITLRVSALECTVATTTAVDFGSVRRDTQSGAEMAIRSYPLIASCSQDSDRINANINVQFRAISGQYNATPSWLALTQGGGYITGEIDNGVTGSGVCNGTGGIPFNNTSLRVGSITAAETTKTIINNITWRLCSGGSSLPIGAVDAATEMMVTFN